MPYQVRFCALGPYQSSREYSQSSLCLPGLPSINKSTRATHVLSRAKCTSRVVAEGSRARSVGARGRKKKHLDICGYIDTQEKKKAHHAEDKNKSCNNNGQEVVNQPLRYRPRTNSAIATAYVMYSVHFAHGSGYEMLVMRSSIFVRTLINGKRQAGTHGDSSRSEHENQQRQMHQRTASRVRNGFPSVKISTTPAYAMARLHTQPAPTTAHCRAVSAPPVLGQDRRTHSPASFDAAREEDIAAVAPESSPQRLLLLRESQHPSASCPPRASAAFPAGQLGRDHPPLAGRGRPHWHVSTASVQETAPGRAGTARRKAATEGTSHSAAAAVASAAGNQPWKGPRCQRHSMVA